MKTSEERRVEWRFDVFAHAKAALSLALDTRKYLEEELARGATPGKTTLAAVEDLLTDAQRHIQRAKALQDLLVAATD